MLDLFSVSDEIAYFYSCHDIEMSSREGYKIKKVECFAENTTDVLSSYAIVKTYYDDSITVAIRSHSDSFSNEIAEYLFHHTAPEVLVTSFLNISEQECFTQYFTFYSDEDGAPTYATYAKDMSQELSLPDGVEISILTPALKNKFQENSDMLSYMSEYDFVTLFEPTDCFTDTVIYCMLKDDKLIGYLRAECGYKNFYDIGWVEIASEFQGQGLGKQLVLFFSKHCFQNGNIPHYGYAMSQESVSLARSLGYVETRPSTKWYKIERK